MTKTALVLGLEYFSIDKFKIGSTNINEKIPDNGGPLYIGFPIPIFLKSDGIKGKIGYGISSNIYEGFGFSFEAGYMFLIRELEAAFCCGYNDVYKKIPSNSGLEEINSVILIDNFYLKFLFSIIF